MFAPIASSSAAPPPAAPAVAPLPIPPHLLTLEQSGSPAPRQPSAKRARTDTDADADKDEPIVPPVPRADQLEQAQIEQLASFDVSLPAHSKTAIHELGTEALRREGISSADRREVRALRAETAFAKARIVILEGVVRDLERAEEELLARLRQKVADAAKEATPERVDDNDDEGQEPEAGPSTGLPQQSADEEEEPEEVVEKPKKSKLRRLHKKN